MASQETANNASESPADRKENMVKPNATLPPGFRARPQGPPGSPRQPINNGPVGQPRPVLGQPPQIRFDNRAPVRPSGSGQFVQLRPYGLPRPPGNQLPPKPPQQGQNSPQQGQHPPQQSPYTPQQSPYTPQQIPNPPQQGQNPPIVLNPRFAPSPINRTGPQQRPRLPHPGNFQGHLFPRNAQPPQHPGFEHQNAPRTPDVLARPQEIAKRQLQRNESLLSFPQQSLSPQREDRKPPLPRIVVERMADVDNVRKQQQPENSVPKEKLRDNAENDDDDDVVMDSKKSPRPDSRDSVQSAKRPETATINGKVDVKPTEQFNDKPNSIAADSKPDKAESQTVKSAGSENRSPSAKLDQPRSEPVNEKLENKPKGSVDNAIEKPCEKADVNRETTNLSAGEKRTTPSPTPSLKDDKSNKSAKESSNEQKPSEQELNVASPDKSRTSTPIEASQNQKDQGLKTPSKSPDKSRSVTPTELGESQKDPGLKTPSRSSENSRSNTSLGSNQAEGEQSLKTPSKSPDKSRASTPADLTQNEEESKVQDKTPDKSRASTPAEVNQAKENLDVKPSESESAEVKDNRQQSKIVDEDVDKSSENTAAAAESKAPAEAPAEAPEQPSEETTVSKDSSDEKPKAASEPAAEAAEEPPKSAESVKDAVKISDDSSSENLQKPTPESKPTSPSVSLPTSAKETRSSPKSPVSAEGDGKLSAAESMLSPPKTPEDSVKGFDNGQRRSLSPKSPTLASPKLPVSPKSPTGSARSAGSEKKRASFVESLADQEERSSKPTTPRIQRAPTPAKLHETLEPKTVTSTTGIENGNGIDDSPQSNSIPATNGVEDSPTKKSPSRVKDADKRSTAGSPVKSPNKSIKSLPRTPETPSSTAGLEKKKVPMNKVQVGAAPSPNLKTVRSKIGSLENTSYKPGGGKVKIENRKLDFSKAQPKIAAKNEKYTPSGGDKKISQVKLQWNAKSKIGSLDNATYKPGGGDKKIETVKLDFKDKAKPKVGSKDNAKHTPGGGNIKIQTVKVDIKAESKIGSLDNVKHRPGGGDKKIFNDRDYLRQTGSNVESQCASGSQLETVEEVSSLSTELLKENLPQPPPTTPTKIRKLPSPSSMVTPKAVRSSFAKEATESKKNLSSKETAKVASEVKKNLNLANSKTVAEEKIIKSPTSPEYPNNPRLKSPDKSSSHTLRKVSPKNIRLPKIVPSPTPPETTPITETHSKISLPKLIESPTQLSSVAH
ncbi:microtubule-associated protein tau isoform X3 [Megalopta genalis]|uniref:microtubule-associated protein tau isoform X3 n=1 Tax=Megalopta genalis TaxID=115081 RepID=UPI003FD23FEF